MTKYFEVRLVNPEEKDGYQLASLVSADNDKEAAEKAEKQHPGFKAVSSDFLFSM